MSQKPSKRMFQKTLLQLSKCCECFDRKIDPDYPEEQKAKDQIVQICKDIIFEFETIQMNKPSSN